MIVNRVLEVDDGSTMWMVDFFRKYELTGEVGNDNFARKKKIDILPVPVENTEKKTQCNTYNKACCWLFKVYFQRHSNSIRI